MNKRNLLIIVENAIYAEDGYKSRIDMELSILRKNFNIYILLPKWEKRLSFSEDINICYYKTFCRGTFCKLRNFLSFRHILRLLYRKLDRPLIYCEALKASIKLVMAMPNIKQGYIFDCHGTQPDEFALYHHGIKRILGTAFLSFAEKKVVENSKAIVTVTNVQFNKFNIHKSHAVFPMLPAKHFYDENDYGTTTRKKLNISEDSLVFVYSGRSQKWQMCEETIGFYKKIEKNQPNSFLLILTRDVEEFEAITRRYNLLRVKIMTADYFDVPKFLDACDYGFCIRNTSIINKVAAPTKVLEYVARNVKPIITDSVGDYSQLLSRNNMAHVIRIKNDYFFDRPKEYKGRDYVKNLQRYYLGNYETLLKQTSEN